MKSRPGRTPAAEGPVWGVIAPERARQLAALAYDTAVDWYRRGWMYDDEWDGYHTAYLRGLDGGPAQSGAWTPAPRNVEAIVEGISYWMCVRNGRWFDEPGMDDPAPWADYGAGSLTAQELLELRRQLRDWRNLRVRAAGGDISDGMARELDDLFCELVYQRAGWVRPHAAAVAEAAADAAALPRGRASRPSRSARSSRAAGTAGEGSGGELAGNSPYRVAVAAVEDFRRTATRNEESVATLEAQFTVCGLDRDETLMTHVRALQDAAAAASRQAAGALKVLRASHAAGEEYHADGRDAAAAAFRQSG